MEKIVNFVRMLESEAVLEGHEDRVWNVSWDWKGELLSSCGTDKTIRLWNRNSQSEWKCSAVLGDAHNKTVRSSCFSPCGRYIASTSFDGLAVVWEKSSEGSWECYQSLEGHENEVKCASWSPSGQYLATSSRDKSVWVWEIDEEEDFQCCSILQHHTQDVKCVKWHPKIDYLVSCGYDDSIRFYKYDGEDWVEHERVNKAHSSTVWDLSFHSDGDRLVSASGDATLKIWEKFPPEESPEEGKWESVCLIDNGYHDGPIYSVDWCPLTGYIATGCGDNAIRIFRESDRELSDSRDSVSFDLGITHKLDEQFVKHQTLHSAHSQDVNCVRWNPKVPGLLASAGDDSFVKLWKLQI